MVAERLEQQVASRLLERLPADEVWLFGSRARGDDQPESDIDLLVVVPDSRDARHVRSRHARGLVADIPAPMDIVVVTRGEWRKQRDVANTLPFVAAREGRLLAKRDE